MRCAARGRTGYAGAPKLRCSCETDGAGDPHLDAPRVAAGRSKGARGTIAGETVYASGKWEVDLGRRELRAAGSSVLLGSRAFEILAEIVRAGGATVSKDRLIDSVWSGAIVDDNTIQAHVSAIRRALGADRGMLLTIPGRGYRISGAWSIQRDGVATGRTVAAPSPNGVRSAANNLPAAVSDLIGRDKILRQLQDLLSGYRVVTLCGVGGIGKTKLAVEVARHVMAGSSSDVSFIELATLAAGSLVATAVARALGLELGTPDLQPASIARAIGNRRLLLLLDNCEHVIDAASELAETVTRICPHVTVLATSREPLRIDGECAIQVPPLDFPPIDPPTHGQGTGDTTPECSAVTLFVARVRAGAPELSLQTHATAIAAIVRRLDGIPLAIEFAAARAATLGVQGVLSRLDDRFELLTVGRRTALPRQQTLRATLDWSYELLSEPERRLLRHLAVFVGDFPLKAAAAILKRSGEIEPAVVNDIASLVSKALLTTTGAGADPRWRLLETIRAYALEKLAESGEWEQAARRHAQFYHSAFLPMAESPQPTATTAWMAQRGREIDNVRQALDWAFADCGDAAIGVALTALCAPVWLYLSLLVECRDQAERALAHPGHVESLSRELQIQLYTTLGVALVYTGDSVQRTAAILTTAEKVSRELDDRLPRLQVLWATWILRFLNGELVTARQVVEQFSQLAQRPQDIVQSGRMMGSTMLYDGRLAQARQHFERLLGVEAAPASQRQLQWYHYDGTVLAQSRLARVLWLQGFIDQAVRLAADGLARAQALDHKLSICFALSEAVCPIALMSGELQCADWSVDMLSEIATRHSFHSQMVLGRKFDAQLRVKRGEPATGVGILRTASRTLAGAGLTLHYAGLIGDYAEVLAANGELSAGQAAIDAGLALAERDGVRWHLAELHRVKGELALRRCEPSSEPVAEACFEEAITVAESQGALVWQLRAAASLARLRVSQGRPRDAHRILGPVYDRFTEGFMQADLCAAQSLLGTLSVTSRGGATDV